MSLYKALEKLFKDDRKTCLATIVVIVLLLYIFYELIMMFLLRERYGPSANGTHDAANNHLNVHLYQKYLGDVCTRDCFAHMRKPFLNPRLMPLDPSITE